LLSGDSGGGASPEGVGELSRQLGLGRPYYVQSGAFPLGLLRLEPGPSVWTKEPVLHELAQRLPVTLELAFLAVLISWAIAVPSGGVSAVYHNSGGDEHLCVS